MEKVAFRFNNYYFTRAKIEFPTQSERNLDLNVKFIPKGEFIKNDSIFNLYLTVIISSSKDGVETNFVEVNCFSEFIFSEQINLCDIPGFFYPNSIAIIFPYIRAFISTLSLQANMNPIILPTMNLTSLQEELKNNTTEK
ncbi:protein-export chaperone SecB [Phocaeicola plebeius]|uniref:protein-export chaperone SecB n=1 Tax=Phocaeicola plebeius TaxID=310297 RepID=UPI0026F1857A|nr:protein-export chaperone SecB [Phocaeicola plebeius]